jgi:glucokinase
MSAGAAVGAAIAHLVNVLDPMAVVLGGGLGLAGGQYRMSLEAGLRACVWSDQHRNLPLLDGKLGPDAGWIGAALFAANKPCSNP